MESQKQSKIYYVAGPITGVKDYKRHFAVAACYLKKLYSSAVILNPANWPPGLEHGQYMQLCKPMVQVCTHVYFLKGWENSKGAVIEHSWATEWGKIIEYEK